MMLVVITGTKNHICQTVKVNLDSSSGINKCIYNYAPDNDGFRELGWEFNL